MTGQWMTVLYLLSLLPAASSVCDGNPHQWDRIRRCDQYDARCPDATWAKNCSLCEGVGGLALTDGSKGFRPTTCTVVATPEQLEREGKQPKRPIWPQTFVNTGFYEQQIFVHHDPFCLAQIPSMVSNGTHCFKNQEGTFNYDSTQSNLRIDYLHSRTTLPKTNMTEHFYHLGADGTVHPLITKYGVLPTPACPCIKLGVKPVASDWAHDALYLGRERLGVEFLWTEFEVDHFNKGPHHVWTDVATGNVVRMYQPFNGLEVFDPTKYEVSTEPLPASMFKLPFECSAEAKLGCINGEQPANATKVNSYIGEIIKDMYLRKMGVLAWH